MDILILKQRYKSVGQSLWFNWVLKLSCVLFWLLDLNWEMWRTRNDKIEAEDNEMF